MSKILVTGASGNLGRKTLLQLLKKNPPSKLAAFVRDPDKAKDLAGLGIEVRKGDYFDPESLKRGFKDVEKLMLISTHAFTDRRKAHANAINAAVDAGIKHVVYMPIIRKANSSFVLQEVTEEDKFTEKLLMSSGLVYTLAKHPPFLDVIGNTIGMNAAETGVRIRQLREPSWSSRRAGGLSPFLQSWLPRHPAP
jgi:NAD(P)H dehydrogenase (quinone)